MKDTLSWSNFFYFLYYQTKGWKLCDNNLYILMSLSKCSALSLSKCSARDVALHMSPFPREREIFFRIAFLRLKNDDTNLREYIEVKRSGRQSQKFVFCLTLFFVFRAGLYLLLPYLYYRHLEFFWFCLYFYLRYREIHNLGFFLECAIQMTNEINN